MDLNEPMMTLQEACDRYFGGGIGPDALRAARKQGRLTIIRLGRKDWVSPAAMRELMLCQDPPKDPGSTSTPKSEPGLSETGRSLDALAAAKATAAALKRRSPRMRPARDGQAR